MHRSRIVTIRLIAAAAVFEIGSVGARAAAPCRPIEEIRLDGVRGGARAAAQLLPLCRPSRSPLRRSAVPSPTIEGPITGGEGTPVISSTTFDLSEVGYTQEEFFISGTANAYLAAGALAPDGRWKAVPAGSAAYRTRILVYRPADRRKFNGTVVVEWLNVTPGFDLAAGWTNGHVEMIREGMAWVGVSAQSIGVEGSLRQTDPARYASLHHPGDSFSYDIFSQASQALRRPVGVDPLGDATPERVIATGWSQSAARLVTYVNAVDPLARVFDGFLVHSRPGGSAALSQAPEPVVTPPGVARIRSDVSVPVLTFQTETDLVELGYLSNRQPDGARFRLWEVAGGAHGDTYLLSVGATDLGNSPDVAAVLVTTDAVPGIVRCDRPINSGPQHFVFDAAITALDRWVHGRAAPSRAPRLRVTPGSPAVIARDPYGNALGGIRTPWVDAPIAALSGGGQSGGGPCSLAGTTVPFDAATLAALYPDHASYVAAIDTATDRAVRAGFLRAGDAELIKANAAATDIGS